MIVHLDRAPEIHDYSDSQSIRVYENEEEYLPHWHNAIEIIMPLSGDFTVTCKGKEYHLNEQEVILIPSGSIHSIGPDQGKQLIMLFDSRPIIDNPALSEVCSVIMAEPIVLDGGSCVELAKVCGLISEILEFYGNYRELTEINIYRDILTILSLAADVRMMDRNPFDRKDGERLRMVIRYIDQNYMDDIDLDRLAEVAGYSRFYFSRKFKDSLGAHFISYIRERRIREAVLLMMRGGLSISEIAKKTGFNSLTTFNRSFKAVHGCSTAEFKKLYLLH